MLKPLRHVNNIHTMHFGPEFPDMVTQNLISDIIVN